MKKTILVLSIIFLLFYYKSLVFLDPDFGWHLKMGEIILSQGVPKTDPFSYTMPSYPFVDHEWLVNVILNILYESIGFTGLAVVFAAVATLVLWLTAKNRRILLILGAAAILPYVGVRTQVVSWLFLAVLLHVLLNKNAWQKWKLSIPIIILLWSNFHGSFALSIVVMLIVFAARSYSRRAFNFGELTIFLVSFLATFLNPYHGRVWWEVWQQVSDTSLRWTIAEWMPAIFHFNIGLITLIPLSIVFIWKYRHKFSLEEKALYGFFLIQAIASTRHVPLWVVVALPLTARGIKTFYKEVRNIKYGPLRLRKFYRSALLMVLIMFGLQAATTLNNYRKFNESTNYPKKAVVYLKENLPEGEIFSKYGWGGYLIWRLPERKVFIDGRMPSWRWDQVPSGESSYIMKDYGDILRSRLDYKPVFAKYGVSVVLWSVGDSEESKEKSTLIQALTKLLTTWFPWAAKETGLDLIEALEKDNWQEVYRDEVAVIYNKPT